MDGTEKQDANWRPSDTYRGAPGGGILEGQLPGFLPGGLEVGFIVIDNPGTSDRFCGANGKVHLGRVLLSVLQLGVGL